jgi:hypothetical protein
VRRKRRTREHVIADLGVNFFERQALLSGYSVERVLRDYGYDLTLYTYDSNGYVENDCVFIQVKSSDKLRIRSDRAAISVRLERAHVTHWVKQRMPVILAVYDARADAAYWLHVQSYFAANMMKLVGQRSLTVHVSVANRLDQQAMHEFAAIKGRVRQSRRRNQ